MTREPFGSDWLRGLDDEFDRQFAEPASSTPSSIVTEDGTVIVTDAAGNSASGRNLQEAQANYQRAMA